MNPFAVGNIAVYHGKGVGLITGLQTRDPRGNPCMICILDLKKSTAQVRIDHPSQTSVRTVMSEEELQEVYDILRKRNVKPNTTTWNRRYRGYIQNINSGIPKEIATVLRDLELLSVKKSLSFGESKIYTDAKELIIEEGAYTKIVPVLEDFLKPLSDVKAKFMLEHLVTLLEQTLPEAPVDVDQKSIKDLQNLALSMDESVWTDKQYPYLDTFDGLLQQIEELEAEANKIIIRNVRRIINNEHKGDKDTPATPEECFAVLRPWRNLSLVGLFEQKTFANHKGYESLKNLFLDKGVEGVEGLDISPTLEPLVNFSTHHLLTQVLGFLKDLSIPAPKKRKTTRTRTPGERRSRHDAPIAQAPIKLNEAIQETTEFLSSIELQYKTESNIIDAQQQIYEQYLELDTSTRELTLESIRTYIDENLEQHRQTIDNDLAAIFHDAREQSRKEREDKLAKKKKKAKK